MNLMMSDNHKKPELDRQIVENLRRAYNKTLEESVPTDFSSLSSS